MKKAENEVLELLYSRNIAVKPTKQLTIVNEPAIRRRSQNFIIISSCPTVENKSIIDIKELKKNKTKTDQCRVCLKQGTISIYGNDTSDDLAGTISMLGGIEVSIFDPYPKYLCESCHVLLQYAISFRRKAQNSDKLLRMAKASQPETDKPCSAAVDVHIDLDRQYSLESDTEKYIENTVDKTDKAHTLLKKKKNQVLNKSFKNLPLQIKQEPKTNHSSSVFIKQDPETNESSPILIKQEPETKYNPIFIKQDPEAYDSSTILIKKEQETSESSIIFNVKSEDNLPQEQKETHNIDKVRRLSTKEITFEPKVNDDQTDSADKVDNEFLMPVTCMLENEDTQSKDVQNTGQKSSHYVRKMCTICDKKYAVRHSKDGILVCVNCFYKEVSQDPERLDLMPTELDLQTYVFDQPSLSNVTETCKESVKKKKGQGTDQSAKTKRNKVESETDKSAMDTDEEQGLQANDKDDSDYSINTTTDSEPEYDDSHSGDNVQEIPNKSEKSKFKCSMCDVQCDSYQAYNKHRLSSEHVARKNYCTICMKSFSPLYIAKHRKKHRMEKSLVCEICGKKFLLLHQLQHHRVTHLSNLPYQCSSCPYRGRYLEALKMHMKSHSGDKQYMCEYCPQKCVSKSNLNRHMQSHTTVKEFKCECNKTFSTRRALNMHIKSEHNGVKEHKCEICGKVFGYRKSLRNHERRVHDRDKLRSGMLPVYLRVPQEPEDTTPPESDT